LRRILPPEDIEQILWQGVRVRQRMRTLRAIRAALDYKRDVARGVLMRKRIFTLLAVANTAAAAGFVFQFASRLLPLAGALSTTGPMMLAFGGAITFTLLLAPIAYGKMAYSYWTRSPETDGSFFLHRFDGAGVLVFLNAIGAGFLAFLGVFTAHEFLWGATILPLNISLIVLAFSRHFNENNVYREFGFDTDVWFASGSKKRNWTP